MINLSPVEQDALYAKLKARDDWDGPNNPDVVLISAEHAKCEASENSLRTASMEHDLQSLGLAYKRVLGSYLGRNERAFAVVLPTDQEAADRAYTDLIGMAKHYLQESVLYLDRYRQAVLHFTAPNVQRVEVGKFRPVTEAYALQCSSWTYDIDQDQYFTTE